MTQQQKTEQWGAPMTDAYRPTNARIVIDGRAPEIGEQVTITIDDWFEGQHELRGTVEAAQADGVRVRVRPNYAVVVPVMVTEERSDD